MGRAILGIVGPILVKIGERREDCEDCEAISRREEVLCDEDDEEDLFLREKRPMMGEGWDGRVV